MVPKFESTTDIRESTMFGTYSLTESQSREFAEVIQSGEVDRLAQEWGFNTDSADMSIMEVYWFWKFARIYDNIGGCARRFGGFRAQCEAVHVWQGFLRATSILGYRNNLDAINALENIYGYYFSTKNISAVQSLGNALTRGLDSARRIATETAWMSIEESLDSGWASALNDTLLDRVYGSLYEGVFSLINSWRKGYFDQEPDAWARTYDTTTSIARELQTLVGEGQIGVVSEYGLRMLDIESQEKQCSQLSNEQRTQMMALYTSSRTALAPREVSIDQADFVDTLNNTEAHTVILQDSDEKYVAYICYEPIGGHIYASALTVNPAVPVSLRGIVALVCIDKILNSVGRVTALIHSDNVAALQLYQKRFNVEVLPSSQIPAKFADQSGLLLIQLSPKQTEAGIE
jgi:hypothetical protein